MNATVKAFRQLATKIKRLRNSASVKYWEAHEDENNCGWGLTRRYPYRKSAAEAIVRLDSLETQAFAIYEDASADDKAAIELIDDQFIVTS